MKLQEIYTTPTYQTPRAKDEGIAFGDAYDLADRRHIELAPEDRAVKPSKFLYAGSEIIRIGGNDRKVDYLREAGSSNRYLLTEHAFGQLAKRVGPDSGERVNFPGYLRACDEKLRNMNLNAWMQKNGGDASFMRTVSVENNLIARSFLSDIYADVDDMDLLEAVRGLEGTRTAQVRMADFNENSMHLRLTWKADRREIKVGDVVEYGVHISNSEIGRRAVRIEPVVYRLICSNGMVSGGSDGQGWYIRHQGDKRRVKELVREAIGGALPAAREMAAKFSAAVKEVIDRPVERLRGLAKDEGLTEAQLASAIEEMLGEAGGKDVTKADFLNGITGAGRRAGEAGDTEARYELERLGAKYLEKALPAPVLEAAK